MSELKCQELKNFQELKYRKVVRQGDICDITYKNFKPRCHIKKISKNLYQKIKYMREKYEWISPLGDKYTQYRDDVKHYSIEIFEMAPKIDEKIGMRNVHSLRHIFRELGYLINSNFQHENSQRQQFITLTYAENMQDSKQLYANFDAFIKRLKRVYKMHEFAWIAIVEPQGRGAWHVHLLLKTLNHKKLELANWDIQPMWGHGITYTERLDNTDNVGAYFRAYLTNAEITDEQINAMDIQQNDIHEIISQDGKIKRVVKGERLKYYPAHMQIYRHSRNITYPDKSFISCDDVDAQYPEITYQGYREIDVGDDRILKIMREQRRKNSKTMKKSHE